MPRQKTGPQTNVALLRGINLGARNKVSMADLRTLFADLGAEEVVTYVQSGNVVFRSSGLRQAELARAIEKRIERDLRLRIRVLLRTKAQLGKVLGANPFAKRDPSTLHVTFLAAAPSRAAVRELEGKAFEPDEFRVVGSEVYLHCPNGYGKSKLSNAFFEQALDVAATTRNWRTVTKLAELTSG
jgi:uncharacterized protein (DUF1697 family)